jgi:thiol-disulfide isomerase/thioredoxin
MTNDKWKMENDQGVGIMSKLLALILFALILAPFTLVQAGGDEKAPVQEKAIQYKNWKLKNLTDGTEVELRKAIKGKKLVMVVYFAPWCGNWKNEWPIVSKLYEKYKADGFDVIAVSEYGTKDETKNFFGEKGAPFTVVVESDTGEARDKTSHYQYRQTTGDTRKWGSPWNIFLEPDKLNKKGDVLTEKAWIVQGELIEENIEPFIRECLGLQPAMKEQKSSLNLDKKLEACDPTETTNLKLKKP